MQYGSYVLNYLAQFRCFRCTRQQQYLQIYLDKVVLDVFETLQFSYKSVHELLGAVLGLNLYEADLLK